MSAGQKSARFRLSPAAAAFVDDAKVQTDRHDAAQHSTTQYPWEDLSAGGKTINFKFTPELYAMATWCKNNVPGGASYLELLRDGLQMKCEQLIQKHYKPDDEQ